MNKLNSTIITHKIDKEANEACCFIYYETRPIFGKKRKAEFDDKLSDAWETLRDYLDSPKKTIQLHKLIRRGFVVEVIDEKD